MTEKTRFRIAIAAIVLVFATMMVIYVAYALKKAKEGVLECTTPSAPLMPSAPPAPSTTRISKWPIENYIDPKPIGIKTPEELSYMAAAFQLLLSVPEVVEYFKRLVINDCGLMTISGLSAFIKEYTASNANSVDIASHGQAILAKFKKLNLVFDNNQASATGRFIGLLIHIAKNELNDLNFNPTNTKLGANPFDMFRSEFENKYKCPTAGCCKRIGYSNGFYNIKLDLNGKSMKEIPQTNIPFVIPKETCGCNGTIKEMVNEWPNFMVKAPVYFLFEFINPTKVTLGKDSPLSDVINMKGVDYRLMGVISSSKMGEFITYVVRGKDWHSFNGETVSSFDMTMPNDIGTAIVALYTRIDP